jgi:hypothetical protein
MWFIGIAGLFIFCLYMAWLHGYASGRIAEINNPTKSKESFPLNQDREDE